MKLKSRPATSKTNVKRSKRYPTPVGGPSRGAMRRAKSYEPHKHDADQTLYLVEGFMELGVGATMYRLNPGDKLELPAFTEHRRRLRRVPYTSSVCPSRSLGGALAPDA